MSSPAGLSTMASASFSCLEDPLMERQLSHACKNACMHMARQCSYLPTNSSGAQCYLCGGGMEFEVQCDMPERQESEPKIITKLAIFGAVANCTNTVLGAGALAVPKIMGMTGIVLYHVLVLAIMGFTCISLHWLVAVTDMLPPDAARNYEGIANYFLGAKWSLAISVAFFFGGLALTMAYIILITTSLSPVIVGLGFGSLAAVELFVRFGITLFVCLPLTLLRDISLLKYTSALGVVSLLFAAIYVTACGVRHVAASGPQESVVWVRESLDIFGAFAMMVSAYSCHIAVIPIYESLGPSRTPALMMKIVSASLFISWAFYEVIGLAGYLQFGEDVNGNILMSLAAAGRPSVCMVVATVGVAIALIFSVPIIVWPLRSCILSTYHMALGTLGTEPSDLQWRGVSVLVMVAVLGLATLVPNVKTALSIVGSIGGSFIVFIYPSAFYLAVVKTASPSEWAFKVHAPQLSMMLIGVAVGVLCLFFSLKAAMLS